MYEISNSSYLKFHTLQYGLFCYYYFIQHQTVLIGRFLEIYHKKLKPKLVNKIPKELSFG